MKRHERELSGRLKGKSSLGKSGGKGGQTHNYRYVKILLSVVIVAIAIIAANNFYPYAKVYYLKFKAKYGYVEFPKGEVRGIDVSRYQGEIDWERLRSADIQGAPVGFVFVKATEGKDLVDKYFKYNFFGARMNNIIRGAYHFYSTSSSAKEQAELFCRTVQLEEGDLPPVLDVEVVGQMTKEQLQNEIKVWLDIVEEYYGVAPIIYASRSYFKENLDNSIFDSYPHWVAHYYVDSLDRDVSWHFWQHTDCGKVIGVDGYVDVNLFNGTYDDLACMTLKGVR